MYLLDTNIVSTLAPDRQGQHSDVVEWLRSQVADLYLSAVTIAEIEAGAAKLDRNGATRRSKALGVWIDAIISLFGNRILPFDVAAARFAGALHDEARARGFEPGFADVAIAATARKHDFMLLTRNVRHFRPFGLAVRDPFKSLPPSSGR